MPYSLIVLPSSVGNSNQGRKRKHLSVLKGSVSYFTVRVCTVKTAPKDASIIKRKGIGADEDQLKVRIKNTTSRENNP